MQSFLEWLVNERRRELVPPEILAGYEKGFQQALRQLLQRVKDPSLWHKFREMLDCPIKDAGGRCHTFTGYIISALIRHGIDKQADLEEVLSYIYATLMLDRKANGERKSTVFTFDADRPYNAQGNPLEARFKTAVANSIRNVASGRIPRLFNTERRFQGTVSADQLPSRPDNQREFDELISDLRTLLKRKEHAYGLSLVAAFDSMLSGQRQRDRVSTIGRQIIAGTILDYARSSNDEYLLRLLKRLDSPTVAQTPKAAPLSTKQKDYSSILSVVDRIGRPAGSAVLGRYRRRWLEYPARDKASTHPNRMAEVLDKMLRDGALRTVPTGRGAQAYLPGPNAEKYRVG